MHSARAFPGLLHTFKLASLDGWPVHLRHLVLLFRGTKRSTLRGCVFISSLCLNSDQHKATLILVLRVQGASIGWPGLNLMACIRQLVAVKLGKKVVKEGL